MRDLDERLWRFNAIFHQQLIKRSILEFGTMFARVSILWHSVVFKLFEFCMSFVGTFDMKCPSSKFLNLKTSI
jgi:hypothetical protein